MNGTISSICEQTYAPRQILVVDGKSTDNTLKEIHAYAKYIDVLISESDDGVYDGMNKAATLAKTEYIIYMNAGDTFCSPNSLSDAMLETATEWPDIILGRYFIRNAFRTTLIKPMETSERVQLFKQGRIQSGQRDWACHQATITRVPFLIALGGYDTKYRILADQDFLFRAYSAGAIFNYSEAVVCVYRLGGISSDAAKSFSELINIVIEHGYMQKFSVRHLYWLLFTRIRSFADLLLRKSVS